MPSELVQHFAYRRVHIGAGALLDIYLLWFVSPIPLGRMGVFHMFK